MHALPRATPESQGVASAAIQRFVDAAQAQIHELHSFMLLRHGAVIAEGWWAPYRPEKPHVLMSVSKSFTAAAVGVAIADGLFGLDDPVASFFPEFDDTTRGMRIRHLLTMSTGHAEDAMSFMGPRPAGDWIRGFFEVPVVHEPGTRFVYNTGATYLLSAIVQKTTGEKVLDYLQPRLFDPLGIAAPAWLESPEGITTGGYGLSLRTEDIARFGQLYLQDGVWEGRQIVPADWVREASAFQMSNADNPEPDWSQGYGFQFWRCRHNAYRGDGAFGQYCIVMPDQDVVLAITGGLGDMQEPLDLVWDILLPSFSPEALPAVPDTLTATLTALALAPLTGAVSSPVSAEVSGRTYRLDHNELGFTAVTTTFDPTGATLMIAAGATSDAIACGNGGWVAGRTTVWRERWLAGAASVACSGAWIGEDTFTALIRFDESPVYRTAVFRYSGDDLSVEITPNVGFDTSTVVIKGHAG